MTEAVATDRSRPPVLVLGMHRSGTSAVTGLLAEAGGLALGQVLPPTPANPKGYYESAAVVRGHNVALSALDRDWTCPPPDFDPAEVPTAGIRGEVAKFVVDDRPWGVKDPRLLYMLPLWVDLVPTVRMIGVVRDHEEVVRSLVARDGLDAGVADAITRAHLRRLRRIADRFTLPVVDFSAGSATVLERTRAIAGTLGLSWDEDTAAEFYDASLAGSRARGLANDNVDLDHLRATAIDVEQVETVASSDLRNLLDEFAETEDDDLDRYVGPRSAARRQRVWSLAPQDRGPMVEFVRTLDVAASLDPVPEGSRAVACRDLATLHQELRDGGPDLGTVVLPDLTSWLRPGQLEPVLRLVRDHLATDGVVVLGISTADREVRSSLGLAPVTSEEIQRSAVAAGYTMLQERLDDHLVTYCLVALRTTDRLLADVAHQRKVDAEQTERIAAALERLAESALVPSTPSPTQSASSTKGLVPVEDRDVWRRRYERLRDRRSVRAVLWIAELLRPVFRIVRRVRKRRG